MLCEGQDRAVDGHKSPIAKHRAHCAENDHSHRSQGCAKQDLSDDRRMVALMHDGLWRSAVSKSRAAASRSAQLTKK